MSSTASPPILPIPSGLMNDLKIQDNTLTNLTQLSSYVNTNKNNISNSVKTQHSDNFAKAFGDMQISSDANKNILYYYVRNKDLDKLQGSILEQTKEKADAAMIDSQNAKRQFEINEWTANNKGDTLFIMQLAFIALTLNVPLLYLNKLGMVPTSTFWMIMGLIWIAIFLTVIVRAQYTTMSRNNRFWNRRRFASMGGPPSSIPTCEAVSNAISNTVSNLAPTTQ